MSIEVRLPFWSEGLPVAVTQQPGGITSHDGYLYYAWDFELDFTHRIRAIADGTVVTVRETVPDGDAYQMTPDASWGSSGVGNIVTIRHNIDGQTFYSSYLHLRQNSVPVEVGDFVEAGEEIGQVGRTGARTDDHAHIQVGFDDVTFGNTLYGFYDRSSDNGGYFQMADARDISQNENLITFSGYGSSLPSAVIGPPPSEVGGADLTAEITSVTSFAPGEPVTINVQIDNIGSGDATSALAEIALWNAGTDALVAATLQVQHDAVSSNSSISQSFDFTMPPGLDPGSYYFRVEVGRLGNEPGENTSNNFTDYFEIAIGGTGGQGPADLFIQSLSLDNQATITEGSSLGMDIFVGNRGNTNAPSSTVGFYLSNDAVFDNSDVLVDEKDISGIASGDVDSTANSINLSSFSPGTYWLFAEADLDDDVDEGPGENANISTGYQITITATESDLDGPDLVGADLDIDGANFDVGETFEFVLDVSNIGDLNSGEYSVSFYITTEQNLDGAVYLFSADDLFSLSPNETDWYDYYAYTDGTWYSGDYYLAAVIDSNDDVDESDETNNVIYEQFSLNGLEPSPDTGETITGDERNNNISGTEWDDTLIGLNGNDVLRGLQGADVLDGGSGIDAAYYDQDFSSVLADLAHPHLNTGSASGDTYVSIENIIGSSFNDDLRGNEFSNWIWGGDGNDTILGRGGDDELTGNNGNDQLLGGDGADSINAGSGNDTIILTGSTYHSNGYVAFNVSSNTQVGTQVRINLEGLVHIQAVTDGGGDADIVQLSEEGDAFFLHDAYSGFHDSISLTEDYIGNESVARFANIEEIRGMGGDDIIDLTSPDYSLAGVAMTIDGGEGNDVIWGSDANEIISGGNGDDTIFGGIGTDVLTGGLGADVFEFTRTSTSTSVTDFDVGEGDMLRFYNAGSAEFDAASVALTTTGITIAYTDTASGIEDYISVALAESAAEFTATLVEIQNALEII
jgi:Ca2+-binding RTX toxin-like protein